MFDEKHSHTYPIVLLKLDLKMVEYCATSIKIVPKFSLIDEDKSGAETRCNPVEQYQKFLTFIQAKAENSEQMLIRHCLVISVSRDILKLNLNFRDFHRF